MSQVNVALGEAAADAENCSLAPISTVTALGNTVTPGAPAAAVDPAAPTVVPLDPASPFVPEPPLLAEPSLLAALGDWCEPPQAHRHSANAQTKRPRA